MADQIAFKVVYVRAKDGGNPRPFPIVAKDLSASNDSDNLAVSGSRMKSCAMLFRRLRMYWRGLPKLIADSWASMSKPVVAEIAPTGGIV